MAQFERGNNTRTKLFTKPSPSPLAGEGGSPGPDPGLTDEGFVSVSPEVLSHVSDTAVCNRHGEVERFQLFYRHRRCPKVPALIGRDVYERLLNRI